MNAKHKEEFIELMHAAESLGISSKSAYFQAYGCAEDNYAPSMRTEPSTKWTPVRVDVRSR